MSVNIVCAHATTEVYTAEYARDSKLRRPGLSSPRLATNTLITRKKRRSASKHGHHSKSMGLEHLTDDRLLFRDGPGERETGYVVAT